MSPTNVSHLGRAIAWSTLALALLVVARSAGAQAAPSAPPPPPAAASSGPPGAAPPPYMYQEPWTPPPGSQPPPPPQGRPPASAPTYGPLPPPYPPPPYPGPPIYEPAPPPPTYHRAPLASLWLGARLGALFPFGSAYTIGYDPSGYYQYGESWRGLATGGPSVEVDAGGRFGRRYIVYGFWEHAWLGTGDDPSWSTTAHFAGGTGFGEQSSASTDYPGLGFRWSSRPDSAGFLVDLGIGYRWFRESWASGASMTLQGFGEWRAGFGADVRINRMFSLSPLIMFSSGDFVDRQFVLPGQPSRSIPSYSGSHGTITLTIGGHFDLAPSY